MKQIVINKDKFVEYSQQHNGVTTIMLDYVPINDNIGKCLRHKFDKPTSVLAAEAYVNNYYNSLTNAKILSGLTYQGKMVWLSTENQQNYKSAYDLAIQTNGENLPVTVKLGDDGHSEYVTFNTLDELKEFYLSIYNHIQSCLKEGWEKKDSINWTLYI